MLNPSMYLPIKPGYFTALSDQLKNKSQSNASQLPLPHSRKKKKHCSANDYYQKGQRAERSASAVAFRYFQLAHEMGYGPQATFKVGHCIEKGIGVAKNDNLALTWYELAAKEKHIEAIYRIGCLHFFSKDSQLQCYLSAFQNFDKAAKAGYRQAQLALICFYERGIGPCQNQDDRQQQAQQLRLKWHLGTDPWEELLHPITKPSLFKGDKEKEQFIQAFKLQISQCSHLRKQLQEASTTESKSITPLRPTSAPPSFAPRPLHQSRSWPILTTTAPAMMPPQVFTAPVLMPPPQVFTTPVLMPPSLVFATPVFVSYPMPNLGIQYPRPITPLRVLSSLPPLGDDPNLGQTHNRVSSKVGITK